MKNISTFPVLTVPLFALALSACGGGDPATDRTEPGSAVSNAQAPAGVAGGVVFEHAYSETGRFMVLEYDDGMLGYIVTGKTGLDDADRGVQAMQEPSVVETFTALTPGQEVPERLLALNDRIVELQAQRKSASELQPLVPELLAPAQDMLQEKSYSSFLNNVCKEFPTSSWYSYFPWGCWYSGPTYNLFTDFGYNSHYYSSSLPDRIYVQNDGPVVGIVGVTSNFHLKEGYYTTIGAWNWGAAAWFTPPNWRGVIWGDEDEEDNTALGITIHYAYNSTT